MPKRQKVGSDLKLRGERVERVAERVGRTSDAGDPSALEAVLIGLFADVDVVLSVAEHAVHELGETTGGCEDCDSAPLVP